MSGHQELAAHADGDAEQVDPAEPQAEVPDQAVGPPRPRRPARRRRRNRPTARAGWTRCTRSGGSLSLVMAVEVSGGSRWPRRPPTTAIGGQDLTGQEPEGGKEQPHPGRLPVDGRPAGGQLAAERAGVQLVDGPGRSAWRPAPGGGEAGGTREPGGGGGAARRGGGGAQPPVGWRSAPAGGTGAPRAPTSAAAAGSAPLFGPLDHPPRYRPDPDAGRRRAPTTGGDASDRAPRAHSMKG